MFFEEGEEEGRLVDGFVVGIEMKEEERREVPVGKETEEGAVSSCHGGSDSEGVDVWEGEGWEGLGGEGEGREDGGG